MANDKIIDQKVEHLIGLGLIDYIQETSDGFYKLAHQLIRDESDELPSRTDKILFLERIISTLEHYKAEHEKVCPEKTTGSVCIWEQNYDATIRACTQDKKDLILAQSLMPFEQKVKLIMRELASRENREGELHAILQECDISYTKNDINDFTHFFREYGYVTIKYSSKDGIGVSINQSGLDYLRRGGNQEEDLELWRYSAQEKPVMNMDAEENAIKTRSNPKPEPGPTKHLQQVAIWVTIILSILGFVFKYLLGK